jgi:hypothetical protein
LIELAINKFMSHYEANGCQAMKSADQVVPSSGEFKNPANPALLQPHIKIESLLDQLVKSGSFFYFDIPKIFLFFIVEIKRIPETTGLDPVVIVNSMFSTFGYLCRARIPARDNLSQPENERFLPDRSVDGIGSIRSSFSSFSLSSPSCWTFPQLSTIVPLSAYPSQMVVRYSLQCRSPFRTRPSRTSRFRPVPGHKNQLTTLCQFQNGSTFG